MRAKITNVLCAPGNKFNLDELEIIWRKVVFISIIRTVNGRNNLIWMNVHKYHNI